VKLFNHTRGDAGALINAAGLAVLNTTDQKTDAEKFATCSAQMLSVSNSRAEYPLQGASQCQQSKFAEQLQPLTLTWSELADLKGNARYFQEAGVVTKGRLEANGDMQARVIITQSPPANKP